MKWPDHDEPPTCSRLHNWLNIQDTFAAQTHAFAPDEARSKLQAASLALHEARRPLIWLESVDVQATRAAVELAQATGATLHVAQSPGAELTGTVTATDGWLGTSLAEVASTASLVIHLGQQHLRDAPMFELRFVNSDAQHLFFNSCPESLKDEPSLHDSIMSLQWSKETWLDHLTRLLLLLRDDSTALTRRADASDAEVGILAELLLSSHYTVILWSEDELSDELDGLVVRRLLEVARQVSRTARCSLLCLSQDPGRVTAKEGVLWLTNRTTPVRYTDNEWTKELSKPHSIEQWQRAFDWILCVRNLPSDRPLPEQGFDLVIDAHCNLTSSSTRDGTGSQAANLPMQLPVQAVGLDASGHLMRTDHGLAAFVPAIDAADTVVYPSAADLLRRLADSFRAAGRPAQSEELT